MGGRKNHSPTSAIASGPKPAQECSGIQRAPTFSSRSSSYQNAVCLARCTKTRFRSKIQKSLKNPESQNSRKIQAKHFFPFLRLNIFLESTKHKPLRVPRAQLPVPPPALTLEKPACLEINPRGLVILRDHSEHSESSLLVLV